MVIISRNIEAVDPQFSSQLLEHVITPLADQMCYASLFRAVSPTLDGDDDEEAQTQSPADQFSGIGGEVTEGGPVDGGGPCGYLQLHVRERGLRIM